ncbi:hypothetical protein ACQ86D_37755 [Streptomyces galilaeus]
MSIAKNIVLVHGGFVDGSGRRGVYVAAFAPDEGESVNTLIADPPPGAPVTPILPPVDGFLFLDREKFAASFAGDLPAADGEFLADSQVPWGLDVLGGAVSRPAWRAGATVAGTGGSHVVYVSRPAEVAAFIGKAATGTTA